MRMSLKLRLAILIAWFPLSIVSLVTSVYVLKMYARVKDGQTLLALQARQLLVKNGYQFYASLPQVLGTFNGAISAEDARPEILRQFLEAHDSPIAAYARTIVTASDARQIDYRLITAIAMCESNLGKKMPANSYNAWGYGVYTGESSGAEFANWEHGIEVMAEYLSTKFYSQGLTTPEAIGPIYAPPSVYTGNSWAKCVRSFMDELI